MNKREFASLWFSSLSMSKHFYLYISKTCPVGLLPKKCLNTQSSNYLDNVLGFSTLIMLLADEKRHCLPGPPCLVVCTGSQTRHCPCCLPLPTLKIFSKPKMSPATLWTLYKCVKYLRISSTITFYTNIVTM